MKIKIALTYLFFLTGLLARADTLDIRGRPLDQPIALTPFSRVVEDSTQALSAPEMLAHPEWFGAFDSLHKKSPTGIYWVRTTIRNSGEEARPIILSFSNLSYVDLYGLAGDSLVLRRVAGTFRPAREITPGDGREYFSLSLPPHTVYALNIKVHHIKHYWPNLQFYCQDAPAFRASARHKEMIDQLIFGALGIFFLHTLISWIASFYRPYLWLLLFIVAYGLQSMSLGGYFIDWLTPEAPLTGWLWNIHLVHAGAIGGLLLILDFWKMNERWPELYRLYRGVIVGLTIVSTVSFGIDVLTTNYSLMNTINQLYLAGCIISIIYGLVVIWRGLSRSGRILGYGYILYLSGYGVSMILLVLLKEKALLPSFYLGSFSILSVTLFFSTALKVELLQHEAEKNRVLIQLNELQQQQNQRLEQQVRERTRELLASNHELSHKKIQLEDRNNRIETLIQELHHRVKNNLQLLYGLIRLQLPNIKDTSAKDVLEKNLNRIRAMSIVNEKLGQTDDASLVNLYDFTHETVRHLSTMYDGSGNLDLQFFVARHITVPANFAVPFGLILSELLTNSFKYGLPDNARPAIYLSVSLSGKRQLEFLYHDNGHGYSASTRPENEFSGLSLVKELTRQLHGSMETWYEGGLHYKFLIPV